MDVLRSLLGASLWTVIVAAFFRRFRWSYAPLRASVVAGVLVLLFSAWAADERPNLASELYLDGATIACVAGGALVSFLFYEWRDRSGRDVYKPFSDRARRVARRYLLGALFFVALVVGVQMCVEHQRGRRSSSSAADSEAADRAVDSVLGRDR